MNKAKGPLRDNPRPGIDQEDDQTAFAEQVAGMLHSVTSSKAHKTLQNQLTENIRPSRSTAHTVSSGSIT